MWHLFNQLDKKQSQGCDTGSDGVTVHAWRISEGFLEERISSLSEIWVPMLQSLHSDVTQQCQWSFISRWQTTHSPQPLNMCDTDREACVKWHMGKNGAAHQRHHYSAFSTTNCEQKSGVCVQMDLDNETFTCQKTQWNCFLVFIKGWFFLLQTKLYKKQLPGWLLFEIISEAKIWPSKVQIDRLFKFLKVSEYRTKNSWCKSFDLTKFCCFLPGISWRTLSQLMRNIAETSGPCLGMRLRSWKWACSGTSACCAHESTLWHFAGR